MVSSDRSWRALLLVLVGLAALITGYSLLSSNAAYELHLRFTNASQLVKGNVVEVGGVAVGKIDDITLSRDGLADVRVSIDDATAPVPAGTTATVRIGSLSSVANRVIELKLPRDSERALGSGATIPTTATTPQVELDSILNTLDASTRDATQRLLRGSAAIYAGQGAAANDGLLALDPALAQLDAVARELGRDQPALERFLVGSSAVVGAIAERNPDLDSGLVDASTAVSAVADERRAVGSILRNAPATLEQGSRTLASAQRTFEELEPTARLLAPVSPAATKLVNEIQPLLRQGPGAVRQVRELLPSLRVLLRRLPALRNAALPAVKTLNGTLDGANPIVAGALPYLPDVFHGLVNGFGGGGIQSYDANGQYARVALTVGTRGTLQGALEPVASALPSLGAVTHLTDRCPGAAYEPAGDHSNPFPQASCQLSQTPPGQGRKR